MSACSRCPVSSCFRKLMPKTIVVTRITLDVFQQGLVWSGSVYSLTSNAQDVIDNFVAFNSPTSYDEYASVITSFVYTASQGGLALATNLLQYTKEVNGTPPVFESFLATPSIYNATSVGNMTVTSKATAASNPSAVRWVTGSSRPTSIPNSLPG